MNKEEILAKSQNDYKDRDPFQESKKIKTMSYAALATIFVTCILFISEILIAGRTNYGLWAIISVNNGVLYLLDGLNKKKKLNIAVGVMWLVSAAAFIVISFIYMFRDKV